MIRFLGYVVTGFVQLESSKVNLNAQKQIGGLQWYKPLSHETYYFWFPCGIEGKI